MLRKSVEDNYTLGLAGGALLFFSIGVVSGSFIGDLGMDISENNAYNAAYFTHFQRLEECAAEEVRLNEIRKLLVLQPLEPEQVC